MIKTKILVITIICLLILSGTLTLAMTIKTKKVKVERNEKPSSSDKEIKDKKTGQVWRITVKSEKIDTTYKTQIEEEKIKAQPAPHVLVKSIKNP